jgi:nitrogen regulatory protein PII
MALEACVTRNQICWYFSTEQKLKGDLATRQACLATQTTRDKFKKGFDNIPKDIMAILMQVKPVWVANEKFVDISEKKDIKSVDALLAPVERFHKKLGVPPGLVIIDWWGRFSDAMLLCQDTIPVGDAKRRFDRDQLHSAKQAMERLGCPGLIMHQLSGAANAKGPGARLTSADAQENKAFNNMFDFAVVLGNRNSEDILKAVTDKARGEARTEISLKLNGAECRIDIAEDTDATDMDAYTNVSFDLDGGEQSDYGGGYNAGL